MRIVSIANEYLEAFAMHDREFMIKHGRPCALILRLTFRGRRQDFAVPFRSNIAPNVPKTQYFALPPRPTTKHGHRHGIHFIKMFPVERQYLERFRIEGNPYYETIQRILDSHEKEIIKSCQVYLNEYETNGCPRFAVDIDNLLAFINKSRLANLEARNQALTKEGASFDSVEALMKDLHA